MAGLRVIGGSARGKRLRSVPGDSTRPITDRTKESLFNILGPDIQNAHLLDMFAGTGSVGIEALSRGCDYVLFLDLERLASQIIKTNLETTGFSAKADVLRVDAFQYLSKTPDRQYEYIYVAPPQYKQLWEKALRLIDQNPGWLSSDAWVIVQIHPKEYEDLELKNLVLYDKRTYGSTLLIFYERLGTD